MDKHWAKVETSWLELRVETSWSSERLRQVSMSPRPSLSVLDWLDYNIYLLILNAISEIDLVFLLLFLYIFCRTIIIICSFAWWKKFLFQLFLISLLVDQQNTNWLYITYLHVQAKLIQVKIWYELFILTKQNKTSKSQTHIINCTLYLRYNHWITHLYPSRAS